MFVFVVAWFRSAQSVVVPKKKGRTFSPWQWDLMETTSTPRLGNALAFIEPRASSIRTPTPYARGMQGAQKQTPFVSGPGT